MRHGTYSIVARDPATGELGAAVQSHWFSVGSLCTWARPGIGAVATQSVVEPAYGPDVLDRLQQDPSLGAQQALQERLAADALSRVRQVGVVDARGEVAVHTGADCIPCAGHEQGDGFSCQANMMAAGTVPAAMAAAFTAAEGDLATRLFTALHGAEREGGDVRGRQSAAMVVVPATGAPWQWSVDLRVEDHADPLAELARLLDLHRAYGLADTADELMGAGRLDEAGPLYARAAELAPESDELLFWSGLAAAQAGDVEGGAAIVARAAAKHDGWRVLLARLSPEFAPAGADVRRVLGWEG
ncbi:MAG TPA: DUF1028 domain-containing protein [Solirubrobacteraceae bacterium]